MHRCAIDGNPADDYLECCQVWLCVDCLAMHDYHEDGLTDGDTRRTLEEANALIG